MKKGFLSVLKVIPTAILALLLAVTVWIVAMMQKDPTEERRFTNTVTVEVRGLGEGLVMTNVLPETVSILMRAPVSTWATILNQRIGATAVIDVTDLEAGEHIVPIKIELPVAPIQITSYVPLTAKVVLEKYETRTYDIVVNEVGIIPAAFKAEDPVLEPASVDISGPVSQLDQIDIVRVVLDVDNAKETISRALTPAAVNENGTVIASGLKYSTDKIKVTKEITLRGGYRVLVVKVRTTGTTPRGYVLDGLTVNPAVATIYSSDEAQIESLPGFIETDLINLDDFSEEETVKVGLMVPEGATLVGDQAVDVTVRVSAVEGSRTVSNVRIDTIGIDAGLVATISPEVIDVFLSGPEPTLNQIFGADLFAVIELHDKPIGQYQLMPTVDVSRYPNVKVQSVTPMTVDVTISKKQTMPLR